MTETTAAVMDSILTCPHCGHACRERMPSDACLFFYSCPQCHAIVRPKAGECCVFCSYGSVRCPPMQLMPGRSTGCGT